MSAVASHKRDIAQALLRLGAVDRKGTLLRVAVREHVRRVLGACDGNRTIAAELLGVPRRTLQRWLARRAAQVPSKRR